MWGARFCQPKAKTFNGNLIEPASALTREADRAFNIRIFACIEEALSNLGEGVTEAMFYQIRQRCSLPTAEFASRPAKLLKCLEDMLGSAGSKVVEGLIVREIRSAFGFAQSSPKIGLVQMIAEARQRYLTC